MLQCATGTDHAETSIARTQRQASGSALTKTYMRRHIPSFAQNKICGIIFAFDIAFGNVGDWVGLCCRTMRRRLAFLSDCLRGSQKSVPDDAEGLHAHGDS